MVKQVIGFLCVTMFATHRIQRLLYHRYRLLSCPIVQWFYCYNHLALQIRIGGFHLLNINRLIFIVKKKNLSVVFLSYLYSASQHLFKRLFTELISDLHKGFLFSCHSYYTKHFFKCQVFFLFF